MEQYEHYISRNIKQIYKKKLISPILYLLILTAVWFFFSLSDIIDPVLMTEDGDLKEYYDHKSEYIVTSLNDLYFTGYTETLFGQTNGYYYYTLRNDECILVLLSPDSCEEGLPYIEKLSIRCKIEPRSSVQITLLSNLAEDLSWTKEGISPKVSSYFLNEPDYHYGTSILLVALILLSGLYALVHFFTCIVYIVFPALCPGIAQLAPFGKPAVLLAQAEEELATLPQLATEDMFITEHFFIEVASSGIAVVPISEIIWIYKHSTLHKFLWYHFSISYTLSITANKHVYIQCPKNMKSDIDGIIDYLSEANHSILVGFSEENRLKVQAIQGTPLQLDKMVAVLKKRI